MWILVYNGFKKRLNSIYRQTFFDLSLINRSHFFTHDMKTDISHVITKLFPSPYHLSSKTNPSSRQVHSAFKLHVSFTQSSSPYLNNDNPRVILGRCVRKKATKQKNVHHF